MENNPFLDNLDDYLSGKMSSEEAAQFAASAEQDPVMKSELQLQEDTVSSIKNVRKLELKARLSQLPVSAGMSVFQKFGIAASTIAGASLLGLGVYYFNLPKDEIIETQPAISTTELVSTPETITPAVESQDPNIEETATTIENMGEVAESNEVIVSNRIEESITVEQEIEVEEEVAIAESTIPEGIGLNPAAIEDEADFVSGAAETPSGLNTGSNSGKTADMQPDIEYAKNKYHYEYDGENLSLHGEFEKDSPYSLIELNYNKKLYLHYDNTYYRIEVTNKKEKLNDYIVTDKFVINELKKYIKK